MVGRHRPKPYPREPRPPHLADRRRGRARRRRCDARRGRRDARRPRARGRGRGVVAHAEVEEERRAVELYTEGRRDEAGAIFARFDSLEARVGAAFAAWPDTLPRLRPLPERRAVVRLHEGLALAALGEDRQAREAFYFARQLEPDTPYAVRADDFLHPRFVPGLPIFIPTAPYPERLRALAPAEQERELARDRSVEGLLRYGATLQRLGRPVSAQQVFDEAAERAPDDPEVLTAAAVARFDKSEPAEAFSRLGPLTRRFPGAQTVRFHLGILLLWSGELEQAKAQLEQARGLGPQTRLGREAERFLERL